MDLNAYIRDKFSIEPEIFLKALQLSPNAQGYIAGAITEFVLRDHLSSQGFEVKRIKEKWEGPKHPNHRGDFYIRKEGSKEWFVLESKGIKSNSEKWHRLYNYEQLVSFLIKHIDLTVFKNKQEVVEYIDKELPLLRAKYADPFYTKNEIQNYKGVRETDKSKRIDQLRRLDDRELDQLARERIEYIRSKINVLETHFVSGGSKVGSRTQATPRVDEFNLISLDLFLRTGSHSFIFVDPKKLARSVQDSNHLQQNYVVDILFAGIKPNPDPPFPWHAKVESAVKKLKGPVSVVDMQVDERSLEEIAKESEITP